MSRSDLIRIAVATAILLGSSYVFAQTPVLVSKDWKLVESAAGLCVASTATKAAAGQASHHLEIVLDKSGARPLELRVRPESAVPAILSMKGAIDAKKQVNYSFSRLGGESGDVFWNIPRGTDAILSFLKRELRFDVTANDGSAKGQLLIFSLRGSSAVIQKLQDHCNAKKPLAADAFERAFLPTLVATVDASKLTPALTEQLRDLVAKALVAHGESNKSQAELTALTNKFLKEINELNKLRKNLDQLTQQEIVKLQKRKADAEATIVKSQSEIDTLRPRIAQEEAKLAQANAAYEAAYNQLKPHMAEHDRLENAVDSEASTVASARARVNSADREISDAQSKVSSLERQLQSLRSELSQAQNSLSQAQREIGSAQSEAQRAQRDYSNAENDVRRFDKNAEMRRRAGYEIDRLDSEARDLDNRLSEGRSSLSRTQQDTRQAESALRQCEADQNIRQRIDELRGRVNDGRRSLDNERQSLNQAERDLQSCRAEAGRDCRREEQQVENSRRRVQTTESRVAQLERELQDLERRGGQISDCSRERQQVQNSRNREREIEQRVNEMDRRLSDVQRRRDQVISEAMREVERDLRVLTDRASEAERRMRQADARLSEVEGRLNRAQSDVSRIENESRSISNSELPREQNRLSQARNEKSNAESILNRASRDLDAAEAALSRFENSVGWAAKHEAVRSTLATVNSIKAELARIDKDIKSRESLIRNEQAAIVETQKQMDVVLEQIRQKEARSQEVQKLLEPYEQQKAVLEQAKAASDQAFSDSQRDFANGLPQ